MPVRYLGGKHRQSKVWAPLILAQVEKDRQNGFQRTKYLEPFLGGAHMLQHMYKHFPDVYAGDTHPDLMALWIGLKNGWTPPDTLTKEEYLALKADESWPKKPLRGFAGFGCAFAGVFMASYAGETFAAQTKRSVLKSLPALQKTGLSCCNYAAWDSIVDRETVVYCDPPYAKTGGSKRYGPPFDHERFWELMDRWTDRGALVFVSEYQAPDNWRKVSELNLSSPVSSYKRLTPRQADCLFTK